MANGAGYDDEDAEIPYLLRNIINVQNHQINVMRGWLDTYDGDAVLCGHETDIPPTTSCLVITGVVDGPLSGGLPKAVELFAKC